MMFTGTHFCTRVRIKKQKTAATRMSMKEIAQAMSRHMIMTGTAPMTMVPLSTMNSMNTIRIPPMGISTSMTMLHLKSMRVICMLTAMIAKRTKTALLLMFTTTAIIFITVIFTPITRSTQPSCTECSGIRHGTGLLPG